MTKTPITKADAQRVVTRLIQMLLVVTERIRASDPEGSAFLTDDDIVLRVREGDSYREFGVGLPPATVAWLHDHVQVFMRDGSDVPN